ncbi:helix-turn-helix domain-containing protein [Deinococcus sonorensis]|uniref:Helix-turn-helix domain-containing protein n=1 Tax=Deinococcus sonorensis TaxID=309891 RepID=A0ABV8YGX7_9DEIO
MTRAQILLLADHSHGEGQTHQAIADVLGCSANRVSNVMRRSADEGLQGRSTSDLDLEPRTLRPRTTQTPTEATGGRSRLQ